MLGDSIVRRPGFGRLHAGVPSRRAWYFQTVSPDRVWAQEAVEDVWIRKILGWEVHEARHPSSQRRWSSAWAIHTR
jgi:hypothetical protein